MILPRRIAQFVVAFFAMAIFIAALVVGIPTIRRPPITAAAAQAVAIRVGTNQSPTRTHCSPMAQMEAEVDLCEGAYSPASRGALDQAIVWRQLVFSQCPLDIEDDPRSDAIGHAGGSTSLLADAFSSPVGTPPVALGSASGVPAFTSTLESSL